MAITTPSFASGVLRYAQPPHDIPARLPKQEAFPVWHHRMFPEPPPGIITSCHRLGSARCWCVICPANVNRRRFSTPTSTSHLSAIFKRIMSTPGIARTFQEEREHLGVETQRQWSDLAMPRPTPVLLGL